MNGSSRGTPKIRRRMLFSLTPQLASQYARIVLGHVTREYPNSPGHVLHSATDLATPRALHPVFYGSFDWHSSVHSHWMLAYLLRRFPSLPEAEAIHSHFRAHVTPANVALELAYVEARAGFERTYGWAWLLMLAAELLQHADADGAAWSRALAPLAAAIARRFETFLSKATYPIRAGTHPNSAFALILAHEYAERAGDDGLRRTLAERAVVWFSGDADCQGWEPGGNDFLSSALCEALCMQTVLDATEFATWFARFLPRFATGEPASLLRAASVSDRSDGQIVHLDGYNLSRAWALRRLARSFDDGDARGTIAFGAADTLLEESLAHVSGDYMGEHWLASFATLALSAADE